MQQSSQAKAECIPLLSSTLLTAEAVLQATAYGSISSKLQPLLIAIALNDLLLHFLFESLQQLALFSKNLSRLGQHHLEALASLSGVLAEALNGEVFDPPLDAVPAAAKRRDLGALVEERARGRALRVRHVLHGLAHREQVREGHVDGAHGERVQGRVHVRHFVY